MNRLAATLLFVLTPAALGPPAARAGRAATPRAASPRRWAEELLSKEADYIVNCSFTEDTRNHSAVRRAADGYGAINVERIFERGPDWVRPGEAAMGAIGLMAAAIQLKKNGRDIAAYDRVLDRFFQTWVLARKQPIQSDHTSPDAGGFYERVYYDERGQRKGQDEPNAGVTGEMLAAMWKYAEYKAAIGQPRAAHRWLRQSWPVACAAGDFLDRNVDPHYHLVRSNAVRPDLWISDSTYAAMAFRCLAHWAKRAGTDRASHYASQARVIIFGLQRLKDRHTQCFYRFRDHRQNYRPTYGDQIDQLCFLPYEADVIDPGDDFARSTSTWWTHGSHGLGLTFLSPDRSDWRNFGTRYSFSLDHRPANKNLYPGPGLQLAKVEWKHAWHVGDRLTLRRARKRFEWARRMSLSNLWLGGSGVVEANVPNGMVDWRDSTDYAHTAGDWARFVDTSAYFIEVTLMLEYGVDTRYVPN